MRKNKIPKDIFNKMKDVDTEYSNTLMKETEKNRISWIIFNLMIRNINNLRYTDDITLMEESEEELKSL